MKAERNKTIDFLPQGRTGARAAQIRDAVCDRTICGDTFQVAPHRRARLC